MAYADTPDQQIFESLATMILDSLAGNGPPNFLNNEWSI